MEADMKGPIPKVSGSVSEHTTTSKVRFYIKVR